MKKKYGFILLIAAFSIYLLNAQNLSYDIHLNQVGYLNNSVKFAAIINSSALNFTIKTSDLSTTVLTGQLTKEAFYSPSGENVKIADFSSLTTSGSYVLVVDDLGKSVNFKIDQNVMVRLSKASIKALYYNRASTALLAEYAGVYARASGHPDTAVVVLPSAASTNRPAGSIISTPGGWYDAGDYNKYVVNSGISTWCLLSAYESFPEYYDTLDLNIPGSGNGIPDILDEALWNIKWLMTMQDSTDGGVYHKTSAASFESSIMPANCTSTRYVCAKGTAATLDFAALMAMTARIYKKYLPELADQAMEQCLDAWQWAQNNPNVPFTNPDAQDGYPHVGTGEYGDENFDDEFSWCATELYITTKEDAYYDLIDIDKTEYDIPGWGNVQSLGLVSLIVNKDSLTAIADTLIVKDKLIKLVIDKKNSTVTSPYKIPCEFFSWGGNSGFALTGVLLMNAFRITGDVAYYYAAISALDYLMGRNATEYCFITGIGTKRPMNIHHRLSKADGVIEPDPGFLVGGPSTTKLSDCGESAYPSLLPAKAYLDQGCSYSSNEVAINWNGPLIYLTGAIQSEYLENFTTKMPEYFIVSTRKIYFPYKAGNEYSIYIEGNGDWNLVPDVDWINLSMESGNGSAELTAVSSTDNLETIGRSGKIYIYHNEILFDSIVVSQNGVRKTFIIQCEDYLEMNGLQTESANDYGGGLNLGYVDKDDWATYDLDISAPGNYSVEFRHAGMAGYFDVYIDSILLKSVNLPSTSDWQDWITTAVPMELEEGQHKLKLLFTNIGVNMNWMWFKWKSELNVNNNIFSRVISIFPVPAEQLLNIRTSSDLLISNIKFMTVDGKLLFRKEKINSKSESIDVSEFYQGLYVLQVNIEGKSYRMKVIVK